MRTINIVNAGSDDYHQGDIVNISGVNKAYNGRFFVICAMHMLSWCDDTKTENKPKKYKSTFIKSHKKVW